MEINSNYWIFLWDRLHVALIGGMPKMINAARAPRGGTLAVGGREQLGRVRGAAGLFGPFGGQSAGDPRDLAEYRVSDGVGGRRRTDSHEAERRRPSCGCRGTAPGASTPRR
jgi:hypothetical protein